MPIPKLLAKPLMEETFGGVSYHILGELVPVLQIDMISTSVYFEHHVLLWKDTNVEITLKSLQGAFKRLIAGLPIFMTEAVGRGRISFSRDGAGHVFAFHLAPGQAIDVREHQFLAATDSINYTFKRVKGFANMLLSGSGLFIDTFSSLSQEGIVWLHGYGNVFEVMLQAGEQIDVEPGAWVYKDHHVEMETKFQNLSAGLFASSGQFVWNRFTGPGRVGIQSMSPMTAMASSTASENAGSVGILGLVIKSILR